SGQRGRCIVERAGRRRGPDQPVAGAGRPGDTAQRVCRRGARVDGGGNGGAGRESANARRFLPHRRYRPKCRAAEVPSGGRMKTLRILALLLVACSAFAGESDTPIQDNSFLVEEAYNQEADVVQHILTFTHSRHGDWTSTFTQ